MKGLGKLIGKGLVWIVRNRQTLEQIVDVIQSARPKSTATPKAE